MTRPTENFASIEHMNRATREVAEAVTHGSIPASAREVASESVRRTRAAYELMSSGGRERASDVQRLMLDSQSHATAIISQIMRNMTVRSNAAFDAWAAMVQVRSLPEAAEVQADFVQDQLAMFAQQSQELFQLALSGLRASLEQVDSSARRVAPSLSLPL